LLESGLLLEIAVVSRRKQIGSGRGGGDRNGTGRTPIQLLELLEMLESDLPEHFFETEAGNLP
jgi:hypothetical protein